VLRGQPGSALAFASARITGTAGASRSCPRPNAYCCLNVGQKNCGNGALRCSGICQDRRPRKGKRDKRKCVSHDAQIFQPTDDSYTEPAVLCGKGLRNCTTGNAGFCGKSDVCGVCSKDADCEAMSGQGAACVVGATRPLTGYIDCYARAV